MTKPDRRRMICCGSCGKRRPHRGHGKCGPCYRSSYHAQNSPWKTPGAHGRGVQKGAMVLAGRIEDFFELTRDQGYTLANAAARMQISERTAWRYEARIRAVEAQECAA